ncbi:DsbA family protein [Candidatus Collierbacteria bacterium]|nr:DsbA family protein [Candidatus Collierbacteria bacterium]
MNKWKLTISIVVVVLVFLIGASFALSKPIDNSSVKIDQQKLVFGALHIFGNESAPVTVVEFSDFQCPACRSASATLDGLLAKHDGKIKFIYRHFPLTPIHKNSMAASIASEAAGEQGKFWEYSKALFEKQDAWEKLGSPQDLFINLAKEVGVADLDKFKNGIGKQLRRDMILADMSLGNQLGVNATPTFFVNGNKVSIGGLTLAVEKILSKPQ